MATSAEIQARRDRIAELFREDRNAYRAVKDVLQALLDDPGMLGFWEDFAARQQKLRSKPAPAKAKQGKATGKKPTVEQGLDVTSAIRLLQRDLEALEKQGLVEAYVVSEGQRVAVGNRRKSTGTGPHAAQPLLWRAGPNLTDDVDLENVAAVVALDAICGSLSWLIPETLAEDFNDARDRARRSVKKMHKASAPKRWLEALALETPFSPFERPLFDEDVRKAVEDAILQRKKLQIEFDGRSAVVSVARFVVKLPDQTILEVLEHDNTELWPGGPSGPWRLRIRLESITGAILLAEDSEPDRETPLDNDPQDAPPRAIVYEFRASPRQMERWSGTWMTEVVEKIGVDGDEWSICRYVDKGDAPGLRRYLSGLGAEVEILKPLAFRAALAQHFRDAAAMYQDVQDVPADVEAARKDAETLAAWGGTPRLVRPDKVPFTEDDQDRLRQSKVWQEEPGAVESLCRLFCTMDPAGVCSPENPHLATEYLRQAEVLVTLLPSIHAEPALAKAMKEEFHRSFASPDPADEVLVFEQWDEVASMAWLELTAYRVKQRGLAVD